MAVSRGRRGRKNSRRIGTDALLATLEWIESTSVDVRSWPKADMNPIARCLLLRSLLGVKRTRGSHCEMSAYDPKRTLLLDRHTVPLTIN
jgi:hypothetical protein